MDVGLPYEEVLLRGQAAGTLAAWVVRQDDGQIISCGLGWVLQRLPSVWNPTGRAGWIQGMWTHPDHRRLGHGSRILTEILAWLAERQVGLVQLVATEMGEPLYRKHGFDTERYGTALTLPMVNEPWNGPSTADTGPDLR